MQVILGYYLWAMIVYSCIRGICSYKPPLRQRLTYSTILEAFSSCSSPEKPPGKYFCYFLESRGKLTYNGYTVDLTRRLRQHNGELSGGAKGTRGKGPWKFFAVLHSETWTAQRAMQVEWLCRYPTRKKPRPRKFVGPGGRIKSLPEIFARCDQERITLYVSTEWMEVTQQLSLPSNVELKNISMLMSSD